MDSPQATQLSCGLLCWLRFEPVPRAAPDRRFRFPPPGASVPHVNFLMRIGADVAAAELLIRFRSSAQWALKRAQGVYRTADDALRLLTEAHILRMAPASQGRWRTSAVYSVLDTDPLRVRGRWSEREADEDLVIPQGAISLDALATERLVIATGTVVTPALVLRTVRAIGRAEAILGVPRAHQWLMTGHAALDGNSPMQMLYGEAGTALVDELLRRMEEVIAPNRGSASQQASSGPK